MYKVYINGLLNELTQHSCALSLNKISLTSPSFADDISLLSIYPTFLSSLMNLCYAYSIKWRYEFYHAKSGIVTFGESKCVHSEDMKERTWVLGGESVTELYEYKNLGVVKTILGHSPPMLMIISIKLGKKPVCYFPRTLTGGRSTLQFTSSFGIKHASPLYFMVRNVLLLHLHF